MSDLDGLLNLIPVGDIAKKLGIDESVAKAAIAVAVPAIVGGLAANAKAGGAESLENALDHHTKKSTKLEDVDVEDGKKIVNNVFGAKKDDVVAAAATKAGGPDIGAIVAQILPIVAPIVLAFLAQQMSSKKADTTTETAEPASSGTDIGSLLGGLLSSPGASDVVGGLLGGLLGGGKK